MFLRADATWSCLQCGWVSRPPPSPYAFAAHGNGGRAATAWWSLQSKFSRRRENSKVLLTVSQFATEP